MSGWIAGSLVVLTLALVAVVASARLVGDAGRDLVEELARLRRLAVEIEALSSLLRVVGTRRARGTGLPR